MALGLTYCGLKSLKSQLCVGLIAFKLNGLKRAQIRFVKLKVGISALKRQGALQISKQLGLRSYFGLSNSQLSILFNCSKSEANRIKINCIKAGLLVVNKKFKLIGCFSNPDHKVKYVIPHSNRIRFAGNRKSGIKVYEQLTDELIPLMFCKRVK